MWNFKNERNMEEKKYHSSLFCRILEKVFGEEW